MPQHIRRTLLCATVAATLLAAPLVSATTAARTPRAPVSSSARPTSRAAARSSPSRTSSSRSATRRRRVAVDGVVAAVPRRGRRRCVQHARPRGHRPRRGTYLVRWRATVHPTGAALPTPDDGRASTRPARRGRSCSPTSATALTLPAGAVAAGTPGVVDLLGYGTSNTFESAVALPATGEQRAERPGACPGATDTDVNAADFSNTDDADPDERGGRDGGRPTDPTTPTDGPDPPADPHPGRGRHDRAAPGHDGHLAVRGQERRHDGRRHRGRTPPAGSAATRSRPRAPAARST